MTLGVYYEERDGQLLPIWLLLPVQMEDDYVTYNLIAPFERIEDFHDSLSAVTVTMSTLSKGIFDPYDITIHVPTVQKEIHLAGYDPERINEADYFILQMADVEEILQLDVKRLYQGGYHP
ncbi:hypothetical protein [Shouchella miscanthi]|uniref:hypothetical protein n=1 Tax=Shouchella miscanthi TaxID=2598861 RepID=UPI0011A85109|nr:hypothetical protein [Shouchella miscanthi]